MSAGQLVLNLGEVDRLTMAFERMEALSLCLAESLAYNLEDGHYSTQAYLLNEIAMGAKRDLAGALERRAPDRQEMGVPVPNAVRVPVSAVGPVVVPRGGFVTCPECGGRMDGEDSEGAVCESCGWAFSLASVAQ